MTDTSGGKKKIDRRARERAIRMDCGPEGGGELSERMKEKDYE